MSRHNYNNHYNRKNPEETMPEMVETAVETTEEVEATMPEVVETPIEVPVKPTKGVVHCCDRLNVREKPNTIAAIVCIINEGDKVQIDLDQSTNDWYKVKLTDKVEGYCMKQFIAVLN